MILCKTDDVAILSRGPGPGATSQPSLGRRGSVTGTRRHVLGRDRTIRTLFRLPGHGSVDRESVIGHVPEPAWSATRLGKQTQAQDRSDTQCQRTGLST